MRGRRAEVQTGRRILRFVASAELHAAVPGTGLFRVQRVLLPLLETHAPALLDCVPAHHPDNGGAAGLGAQRSKYNPPVLAHRVCRFGPVLFPRSAVQLPAGHTAVGGLPVRCEEGCLSESAQPELPDNVDGLHQPRGNRGALLHLLRAAEHSAELQYRPGTL